MKSYSHLYEQFLTEVIDATETGIPFGFYTSQWFANWYLTDLDHYITEQLHADHYIRYMDDMVIFGSNKRKLHRIRKDVDEYLRKNLGLVLKDNWQVFRFDYVVDGKHRGRDLDFMGFRFFRDKVILRKCLMVKATRKARHISRKQVVTVHDARQMLAYLGWIDATNTYGMYRKRIKPFVSFQQLERMIGRYDRYRRKERLEKTIKR